VKQHSIITQEPSTDTYKNGTSVRGLTGYATMVDTLIVPSSGQGHGDFKSPNAWSYSKISSTGFRSQCVLVDPSLAAQSDVIKASGGHPSILDVSGRLTQFGGVDWNVVANAAAGKLSSSVRGDLDVSIDLFQFRQTAKLVDRIWNLSRSMKQSWNNAVRRQGPVKEVANIYLEWTYGLAPTLQTLWELAGKIQQDGLQGKGLVHCRGRGSMSDQIFATASANVFSNPPWYQYSAPIRWSQMRSWRCQYDVYLKPELTQWQKIGGYTSLNPVSWIYESVPYSFVLDYFWNFSRYLRSMETAMLHAARFQAGTATYSLLESTSPVTSQALSPDGKVKLESTSGNHVYKGYDRQILTAFPVPKLPALDIQIGARRMVNIAALLSQFLPDMFAQARTRKTWALTRPLGHKPYVI
jgi:hypothetical protein